MSSWYFRMPSHASRQAPGDPGKPPSNPIAGGFENGFGPVDDLPRETADQLVKIGEDPFIVFGLSDQVQQAIVAAEVRRPFPLKEIRGQLQAMIGLTPLEQPRDVTRAADDDLAIDAGDPIGPVGSDDKQQFGPRGRSVLRKPETPRALH